MTSSLNSALDYFTRERRLRLNRGRILGCDRRTKQLYLTLHRNDSKQPWGFSLAFGTDLGPSSAHWSGIVAYEVKHKKGLWLKVMSVRQDTSASESGLRPRDFITRINGQIVFHLSIKDVERIVNQSGNELYIDVERDSARSLMFDGGVNGGAISFLCRPVISPYDY